MSITLSVLAEDAHTLTLGWGPVAGGALGYEFLVDGKRVSNTWDPTVKQTKFGKPDAGEHTYQVVALSRLDSGSLLWPVIPTPPEGWTVALPGSTGQPVTTISHPVGAGVNAHNASDPMVWSDYKVIGGTDNSFLVQPGAPGRTFQRCQSVLAVEDGQSVPGNNKHGWYVKAPNTTILDYAATAAPQADGGFSVRFAGFLAQRFDLDNFQLPLCIFADDMVKGPVVWRQGRITKPRVGPVWLDCDQAAKMVYDVLCDQIDFFDWTGPIFAANTANFAGTLAINACTIQGKPITAADASQLVRGIPASALKIT